MRRLSLVLSIIFILSCGELTLAQEIPLPSSPEINFTVKQDLALTGRLAFSIKLEANESIYLLDFDAKQVRRFISDGSNNNFPAWSPDGTKLAFVSDRDGNREIYVADWDGLNQLRLTNNQVTDDNPSWTKNSKGIIYYSETSPDGMNSNLFYVSASGAGTLQLTKFNGRNSTPKVSPDGKLVAYSTNRFWPGWDICVWNIAEKTETCPLNGDETYCRPDWSPDGASIAYSQGAGNQIDIGRIDLGSKLQSLLTTQNLREYDATFSPDGKYLAFTGENGTQDLFSIFAVELESKKILPILSSKYSIRYLSWSPVTTMALESNRMRELQDRDSQTSSNTPTPLAE